MKKCLSLIMAVCMLACGAVTAVPATAQTQEAIIIIDDSGLIVPFASNIISSWSPTLSRNTYGANITLRNVFSGSVTVELHDRSGYITCFTEPFTNRISIAPMTSRTTAPGTYKIVIKVTVTGQGTDTRESLFMNLS
jgi:hypothetical protein